MTYAWARFLRGQGLGNRLFSWARARTWAGRHGIGTLAPRWTRWSVGAFVRGGIDLASYRSQIALLGQFRPHPGDVTGRARRAALRAGPFLREPQDLGEAPVPGGAGVVVFEGYRGFFAPLVGQEAALLADLRAIAHPSARRRADRAGDVDVAINVRCGNDFPAPAPRAARIAAGDRTPVGWFVELLAALRAGAGRPLRAVVVSDGTRGRLADLLAMENVVFARPGAAASDLLLLTRARVLLASGSSSFSAWGAFLGGMPVATHPGQPMSEWRFPPRAGAVHAEVDARAPDPAFLASALRRL